LDVSAGAWPPLPKHVALTWARCLKRVFGIEIEQCVRCGGMNGAKSWPDIATLLDIK
jgi:hypothetical protein